MALDTVLAGIAGGLQGLNAGYADERHSQDNERKLAMQDEIARLRADVMQKIAELNAGSRERVADTAAGSRRDVAETNAGARRDVAETGAAVTRRGQDLNYTIAGDRNDTTRRGQDITSGDRRYVADTGASTTRRGQDIGAATARRGQDFGFSLGSERNALVERGQDIGVDTSNVAEAGRTTRAGMRRPAFSFDQPAATSPLPVTPPAPAAAPVAKPPSVVQQRGTLPVTPRAVAPAAGSVKPGAAAPAPMAALEQQAAAKLAQLRSERDPQKQAAIREELRKLKAQRDALLAPPTGGAR